MLGVERLPPISAALVIESVALECARDLHGEKSCETEGIGPLRRKLGHVPPPSQYTLLPMEVARDQARTVLAGLCEHCPFDDCPMKLWDISVSSG